ncbi:MAG: hypothetical protein ACHP84_06055 [Caulobacterales bacterium]
MSNSLRTAAACAALFFLSGAPVSAADSDQPAQPVPLDSETVLAGIPVACTGIGQTKQDPKWAAYPVRLEFANPKHEYLADEVVTLYDGGRPRFTMSCEGPWVLMTLPAGKGFKVEAMVRHPMRGPVSATVKAPKHGQTRFVLTFPNE